MFFLVENKGFCQKGNKDNLLKISKSYLDYRQIKSKFNEKSDILIVSARDSDSGAYYFFICIDNIYNLVDTRYDNLYKLKNFKLIIGKNSDRISLLSSVFQEIPYEDVNKGKVKFEHETRGWRITLNKDNEVLSIASEFRTKGVIAMLKKNNVKFAKDFKVTRAYPGQ